MSTTQTEVRPRRPLRLWPGIVIAAIVILMRFVVPVIVPAWAIWGILAAVGGAVLILLWWLFLSRAPWIERIAAVVLLAVGALATWPFLHPSITGGMMGRMFPMMALPLTFGPALVAWAVATRHSSTTVRRVSMAITIVLSCAVWTLARTDGVIGEAKSQLRWRWTPTAEERLLAQGVDDVPPVVAPAVSASTPAPVTAAAPVPAAPPAAPVAAKEAEATPSPVPAAVIRRVDWPGFLGKNRDNVIRNARVSTDWTTAAPVEVWRRPVGPGWSSFAVTEDRFYTQEQRGEYETVTCYSLRTGQPIWRHRDKVRFYESNGGPGPRATPTVHNGRVYTLGATAILNALDAETGAVIWTRHAAKDTGAPMPGWGFTGSPLVVNDVVIAATSGRLVGYDIGNGTPRWTRTTGGGGYSSPHLATIAGVEQVLLLTGIGATSVNPRDGNVLWDHKWEIGTAILQPHVIDGDVLIALGDAMGGQGIRRIAVSRDGNTWKVEERWTSRGLKPYFNDYVVHNGHAFGFDGSILACIDLATGDRKWKGGRYGQGQMLLLADQDLLLVLSEEGDLALVKATPDQFTEVTRFKAIEGKTWNHPVLVGNLLLVRNGEEMVALRLAEGSGTTENASPPPPR